MKKRRDKQNGGGACLNYNELCNLGEIFKYTCLEESRRDNGRPLRVHLIDPTNDHADDSHDDERNRGCLPPARFALVEAHEQTNETGDDEEEADEIEVVNMFTESPACRKWIEVEEEEKKKSCNTASR